MKRQLALILARAQTPLEWLQVANNDDGTTEELPEDIVECLSNSRLSTQFKEFGKELGVLEPKSLEDVYKSHLENARTTSNVDSARGNLASTFVNAFVNAGFGNDKLMVQAEEGNSWIYKNKDHGQHRFIVWRVVSIVQRKLSGMMSAAASLGLGLLWDTDVGLSHVDKYTYSSEEHIKVSGGPENDDVSLLLL
jgi:26S proteasome regulatory subunit N1